MQPKCRSERIRDVYRQPEGADGDNVETAAQGAAVRLPRQPEIACLPDAMPGGRGHGVKAQSKVAAGLHLDEDDQVPAPDDQVDFTERGAVAQGKKAIAFREKEGRGDPFRDPAPSFGAPASAVSLPDRHGLP